MSDYDNARRAAARSALRRAKLRARRFELEKPGRERELKERDLKERELMRHQRSLDLRLERAKRDSRRETLKNVGYFFVTVFIIAWVAFILYTAVSCFFFGNCNKSSGGSGRQYDWYQERDDQYIPEGYFDGAYHGY